MKQRLGLSEDRMLIVAAAPVSLFRYPREHEGLRVVQSPWVELVRGVSGARHNKEGNQHLFSLALKCHHNSPHRSDD